MTRSQLNRLFAIVVLLVLGFSAGVFATVSNERANAPTTLSEALARLSPAPTNGVDYQQLLTVWNRLHQEYVNTNIDDQQLLEGAMTGLVAGLGDPYSTYMSADSAKAFQDELSGTFEGVGMQVGYNKDNQVTVIAPLPNSPAEQAGIKAGDIILTVDGKDASTMTLDDVVTMIRGQEGTTVTIVVQRGTEAQSRSFTVTRKTITVEAVTGKIIEHNGKRIADITVSSFTQDVGRQLRATMKSLGASAADGIILDLRNNPGGYLDQAIDVASTAINDGVIVVEIDRNEQKKNYNALHNAILGNTPIVVLVDGGSASASEIVAGALQDAGRATIIGTQTFGKGSVQDYQTLSNGASLKLTVAKWFTPSGRSIADHGITPDTVVDMPKDAADTSDPQREAALNLLAPKP